MRTSLASVAALALLLASSAGSALPVLGLVEPVRLWTRDVGLAEPSGVASNLLGESVVVGSGLGGSRAWGLDPAGRVRWSQPVAGSEPVVAMFPDLGAVVAGGLQGVDNDVVVTGFDSEGGLAWRRLVATPMDDRVGAVAADAGGVYLAGSCGPDGFVTKLDASGTHRWTQRVFTDAEDRLVAVAKAEGGIVVAGWTHDGLRNRALVARISDAGQLEWTRTLTAEGASLRAHGVGVGPTGEVYLAGVRATGAQQVPWVAHLDDHGKVQWQRVIDGERGGAASAAVGDLTGGLLVAGTAPGANGESDLWLTRLTPTGAVAWSVHRDLGGAEAGRALAWSPQGLLTVAAAVDDRVGVERYLDLPARQVA